MYPKKVHHEVVDLWRHWSPRRRSQSEYWWVRLVVRHESRSERPGLECRWCLLGPHLVTPHTLTKSRPKSVPRVGQHGWRHHHTDEVSGRDTFRHRLGPHDVSSKTKSAVVDLLRLRHLGFFDSIRSVGSRGFSHNVAQCQDRSRQGSTPGVFPTSSKYNVKQARTVGVGKKPFVPVQGRTS